jgi:hypothetical protein
VLQPPTSEQGYNIQDPAIHWLNNDILLGVFNCYRLDEDNDWNERLGWRKLSHVCQRWRHLIHECAFHLGMHIEYTNGNLVDTLDHLPPLPLFVNYNISNYIPYSDTMMEQFERNRRDELGIHHALRFFFFFFLNPFIFRNTSQRLSPVIAMSHYI